MAIGMSNDPKGAHDLSIEDVEYAQYQYASWLAEQRRKQEREEIRLTKRQCKTIRTIHTITLIIAGLAFAYSVLFDASVWYSVIFLSIALYLAIDLSTP